MPFGQSDSTILSDKGHDLANTTTNRPTNLTVGQIGFNLTTQRVEVANGTTLNNITDVPDSTVAGTAGNPNALIAGSGARNSVGTSWTTGTRHDRAGQT